MHARAARPELDDRVLQRPGGAAQVADEVAPLPVEHTEVERGQRRLQLQYGARLIGRGDLYLALHASSAAATSRCRLLHVWSMSAPRPGYIGSSKTPR